ncbi:MAG: hypothetical protein ABSF64_32975 [Bryobacteraceae bacterium]|jgi:hypothetical protein
MTKHITHSKLWTTAVALALVLGFALLLSAQDAKPKRGLPKDWSMHHVVFSKPGASVSPARLQKLLKDPRYILQQELRAAMAAPPSLPAPLAAEKNGPEPDISTAPYTGPLPRGLAKALIPPTGKEAVPPPQKHHRFHKDWSVSEGTNGTTGVGQFPATFTQTASACGTDIAIYNTGLGGSGSQATVVAYNNIYASCGGVPTPYFGYNTGTAAVATSVDLSYDGTEVAFIQGNSGSAASLVVVRVANDLGSAGAPTTPTAFPATSYNGCTAPCMTTVAFSGATSDTYSSPFYDYTTDTLYVGDDSGKLHQFTGVFGETAVNNIVTLTGANPAETTTGGWPVQVSSATTGGALGSPVYDATTGKVFIGDYLLNYASTCEPSATNSAGSCGYLYSVVASTAAVVQSHQLDYQYGIVDSPIVDPATGLVFAFAGADNTTACSSGPCAGVSQFAETFAAAATGTEAQVGAGYEFLLSGAFDNNYYNSGTGNLYAVGGTGPQNNTLYQIAITSGTMGTITTGPAVAANYTNGYYAGGLQVTEFYTGTNDYVFAGALMATTTPTVGLVSGFDVTAGTVSPSTTATGTILAQGGPSGIVVDNSLATAQNIYYSTTLNASCTTSGSGGCAVQTIQSAP